MFIYTQMEINLMEFHFYYYFISDEFKTFKT